MAADLIAAGQRPPRRARYLIPQDLPRRAEILAALGVLLVVAHLLLLPAALVLAVCCDAVSRISRWRPHWLLIPGGAGLAWVLAACGAALRGAAAGPPAVAGFVLALAAGHGLPAAAGLLLRWLAGQLPAALILAAAEAAVAWWLRWLHTDEWDLPPLRPGLMARARLAAGAAQIRAGRVLTRTGVCLGLDCDTGRPAAVSWPEAHGGVLVTGAAWGTVSATGFQFVHAAIRRRLPVIAVDLAGDPAFAASVSAVCAAADAPLQVFSAAGPACYEPLQAGRPARKAALITGMIDWAGRAEAARRDCAAALTDIFAVAAAAPAGPGVAVLDDVIRLLEPAALQARLQRVPAYHPRRAVLAARVRASAARLEADPESAALVAGQLTALRASPLGRWLGPAPAGQPGTRITLGGAARDHGVALFCLAKPAHGRPAEMIATLAALDAAGTFAELHRAGAPGSALAWFGRCEDVSPAALTELLATGREAGLACVLATTAPQTAGWAAGQARVLAVHRLADAGLAGLVAPLTGTRLARLSPVTAAAGLATASPPAAPAGMPPPGPAVPFGLTQLPLVTAGALTARADDEFTLIVGPPARRVIPRARAVPAGIPDPRPVRPARLARLGSVVPAHREQPS